MRFHGVMAMVAVQNIERALRFYRDVLGFTVQDEQEEWVVFHQGVGLHVAPDPLPDVSFCVNAVMVTLFVEDVAQAYSELVQRGVPFFLPPTEQSGVTYATLRDTENNLLQIMQMA